jgi:hypothetical protein
VLHRYPSLTREQIWWEVPLAELWCLEAAAMAREGRELRGPTYADLDVLDALRA